jgi:hypothetical protein
MKKFVFLPTVLFIAAIMFLLSAHSIQAQNAKALFYDPISGASLQPAHISQKENTNKPVASTKKTPSTQSVQTKNTGVRYWLELDDPGRQEKLRVNADRIFRSGEKIRIHYSSNNDGYLYILQRGSTGAESLLFPQKPGMEENLVTAGKDLPAPENGWFRFDEYPGYERLDILFVPKNGDPNVLNALSEPTITVPALQNQVAQHIYKHKGSKDLVAEFDNSYFKLNPSQTGAPVNIEDPVVGQVPTGTTPPAAYIVNTAEGKYAPPVVFEIFLRHE